MELSPENILKLAELLRPPEPDVLQGEDLPSSEYEITSNRKKSQLQDTQINKVPKNIEEFEEQEEKEVQELGKSGFGVENRKTPEYSMVYQQAVTPEDVFLQIGAKTPSSASCEHLLVKIIMSGDKRENVDLSVDTNSVSVVSSQYYLKLPLPHAIDPDSSKANWDASKCTLILTLKLDREFDFVNF